jgi:hypothetical protein
MKPPVGQELPEHWPCAFRRGFLSLLPPVDQGTCLKFGNLLFTSLLTSEDLDPAGSDRWVEKELRAVNLDLGQVKGHLANLLQILESSQGGPEEAYRELVRTTLAEVNRLLRRLDKRFKQAESRLRGPEANQVGPEPPPKSIRPGAATPGRKKVSPNTE